MEATHHKTYANIGNEPLDDLLAVCNQCHAFLSGKLAYDPRFFYYKFNNGNVAEFGPDEFRTDTSEFVVRSRLRKSVIARRNEIITAFDACFPESIELPAYTIPVYWVTGIWERACMRVAEKDVYVVSVYRVFGWDSFRVSE
jgi:hypothetical protein